MGRGGWGAGQAPLSLWGGLTEESNSGVQVGNIISTETRLRFVVS